LKIGFTLNVTESMRH